MKDLTNIVFPGQFVEASYKVSKKIKWWFMPS